MHSENGNQSVVGRILNKGQHVLQRKGFLNAFFVVKASRRFMRVLCRHLPEQQAWSRVSPPELAEV